MNENMESWAEALADEHAHLGRLLKTFKEFLAGPFDDASHQKLLPLLDPNYS